METTEQFSDAMLVTGILAGEKKLFEQIIRRYNQRLFRIGMSVLNNEPVVEDAMQSAYIKAYEHLAGFENRATFGTWLTRIMLNECLAQKKKLKRFSIEPENQLENNPVMATPANILANKELSRLLENAIAELPEKYRLVFVLREIEEVSVKETGATLGIEESNVKVRLNRAKTLLRQNLNGYVKGHAYAFHLSRCDRMVHNVLLFLQIN